MTLQRLVLTFTREGVEIQALYRKLSRPGPVVSHNRPRAGVYSDLAPSPRYKVGTKKGA